MSSVEMRRAVRDAARLVDELALPASFTFTQLCEVVSARRGRPLVSERIAFPAGGPSGVLVCTDDADTVFIEANTSAAHQESIGFHEIGHLLHGHDTTGPKEDLAYLFPDLPAELVRTFLGRTTYSDVEEQQAEVVATLLTVRSRGGRRPRGRTGPLVDEVARFESSLGR